MTICHKEHGPSCGAGCFAVCCGNLAYAAEGGMYLRDISPSLFKNIIRYLVSCERFLNILVMKKQGVGLVCLYLWQI